MNAAKNSFMKNIDYITSEKSIRRRLRAESRKICITRNKESYYYSAPLHADVDAIRQTAIILPQV
jgi:hypothetical protein